MLATVASIAALVSCQKENTSTPVQGNGISTITLTIEQPTDENATKTVLGTEDAGTYPINWSTGDKIAVSSQSGSSFEEYTLSGEGGSISGTFTGTSVDGSVYAYYPYNGVTSVNSAAYTVTIPDHQTYIANSFGEGALPMYGVASSTADLHTLIPLMSVLKLQLKGTCKVSRIEVSSASQNLSGTGTVTFSGTAASLSVIGNKYVKLICSTAVQLNESTATLFHIAIPASAEGAYMVKIITEESKILTKTLTVAQAFTAGKMKKTPELTGVAPTTIIQYTEGSYTGDAITVAGYTWAPVNCGFDADHTYGLLYQWGRRYGHGDTSEWPTGDGHDVYYYYVPSYNQVSLIDGNKNTYRNVIYYGYTNWCNSPAPTKNDDWFTTYNPCPTGWHVPTKDQLLALGCGTWVTDKTIDGTGSGSYNGRLFGTSPNQMFLPAAGYRKYINYTCWNRGSTGNYWSSSPSSLEDVEKAQSLYFDAKYALRNFDYRGYGYSVRCVQD